MRVLFHWTVWSELVAYCIWNKGYTWIQPLLYTNKPIVISDTCISHACVKRFFVSRLKYEINTKVARRTHRRRNQGHLLRPTIQNFHIVKQGSACTHLVQRTTASYNTFDWRTSASLIHTASLCYDRLNDMHCCILARACFSCETLSKLSALSRLLSDVR